jgi:hypothetical protein
MKINKQIAAMKVKADAFRQLLEKEKSEMECRVCSDTEVN